MNHTSQNIMIVEDDRSLSNGIALTLKDQGREFIECPDIKSARDILDSTSIDLIILDVNLPDGDGFEFCMEIRNSSTVPILFLTAKNTEIDEVHGFEVGANDYITKPFSLAVLRARTEALLKMEVHTEKNQSRYKTDIHSFDFENMIYTINDSSMELSKTEQKLLYILIANKNKTISREKLMDYIWNGTDEYVYENSLSVVARRLREKLEMNPSKPTYIKTVFGIGYTWSEDK